MCEDPGPQEQEAPAIPGKTEAAAKTLSPISAQLECHPRSGAAGPAPGPLPPWCPTPFCWYVGVTQLVAGFLEIHTGVIPELNGQLWTWFIGCAVPHGL